MRLRLATWNINSVRLRMPLVEKFLETHQPDVLCLQETKCADAEFPSAPLRKLGYEHLAIAGQKGYHGVAIASRLPLTDIERGSFCGRGHARHVCARIALPRPVEVHNFYVPAGGDIPDPVENDKFAHKLEFVDAIRDWTATSGVAARDSILVGDLNIAPLEHDVWSHKALLSVVSHTPVEVEKLTAAFEAGPWVDVMRRRVPHPEKLYTWWSYRSPDWSKADKGRRLDHVWAGASLAPHFRDMNVVKEARGWERPSDHAPVLVEFEF